MATTATDEPATVLPEPADGGQPELPFDVDEPIPFAPTARARRRLAPQTLPALRLVQPDLARRDVARPGPVRPCGGPTPSQALRHGDAPPVVDAADPRRVRARALVRAGLDLDRVADELGVDEAAVVIWTADLPIRAGSGGAGSGGVGSGGVRSPRAGSAHDRAARASTGAATPPVAIVGDGATRANDEADEQLHAIKATVARARHDGRYAAGLALVAAHARATPHGVVVRVEDRGLAAHLLRWLLEVAELDPLRLRVIAVVGPDTAGDRVRHELLRGVGLPGDRLHVTRSARDRPAVVLRVSDLAIARRVEAWQAAVGQLLGRPLDDAG